MKNFYITFILFLPTILFGQIIYDDNPKTGTGTETSYLSIPNLIIPDGGDRLLVVTMGFTQPEESGIDSIVFNGQLFTEGITAIGTFNPKAYSSIWYLPLGTGSEINSDVEIYLSTNSKFIIANAVSFQNINQASPVGNTKINLAWTDTLASIDISTTDSDVVIDNLYSGGYMSITAGENQTEIYNILNGNVNGCSYEFATSNSVNMSWTKPSTSGTHAAIVLKHCNPCNPLLSTNASISNNDFIIFPNPCIDKISIKTDKNLFGSEIDVFDINGKLVLTIKSFNERNEIDLSDLPKGLYILKFKTREKITTHKIMKL